MTVRRIVAISAFCLSFVASSLVSAEPIFELRKNAQSILEVLHEANISSGLHELEKFIGTIDPTASVERNIFEAKRTEFRAILTSTGVAQKLVDSGVITAEVLEDAIRSEPIPPKLKIRSVTWRPNIHPGVLGVASAMALSAVLLTLYQHVDRTVHWGATGLIISFALGHGVPAMIFLKDMGVSRNSFVAGHYGLTFSLSGMVQLGMGNCLTMLTYISLFGPH
jgi:hypothetical protein